MTISADAEKLFGTDEPTPERLRLAAGPLSLELEGGAIRYIRYAGHEAIRGIEYLVRDSSWRTPPARFTTVRHEETPEQFVVDLDAEVEEDDIHCRFRLSIEGKSSGSLEVRADGEALSGFLTNRIGFVILHPIVGVAGRPVTVTHKDGSISETRFPELISPSQPIFDIRALRHEVTPGLFVNCRMEAALPRDPQTIFEMEDHRNWTDASYKTYVGSLLDPWPYPIEKGDRIVQRISLSFQGTAAPGIANADGDIVISFGDDDTARVPEIGLGLMPDWRSDLADPGHPARRLHPGFVTIYAEADAPDFAAMIADYAKLTGELGTTTQLELVLPAGRSPEPMLAAAADSCRKAGLKVDRLIACPAPYLESIQPVGPWPEVIHLGHIYNAARTAFPGATILGGMLSYFTELNRKRPPTATVDGVTCTTAPIVHAADDRSVMETLEALPAIVASMTPIAEGKTLHIGPSAIGMRHNPYGAATAPNPDRRRIPMAEEDPRQRGLFAAAWTVGYAAAIAATGRVKSLALNHLAGPSGIARDGILYPVFHVMAALGEAGGNAQVPVSIVGTGVAGLAWRADGRTTALIANLGAGERAVSVPSGLNGRILDAATFHEAAGQIDWRNGPPAKLGSKLTLPPYGVLFARS